ncbi:MAG TPA: FAD-dependent oxidoreductase, partial [Anaeromyxobacteraceae bacterium]|nr:FAD-dependent oxidoreductase [Anaeromyxobacteraceae bacterium]
MDRQDVIVVGAGVSGLAFAWKAARSGRRVLVLERADRIGGCIHSVRRPDGFWFEMGAHTTYNSYGGFLDVAVGTGAAGKLVPRGPARARFGLLRGGEARWLTPPKVLLELSWVEAAVHFPLGFFRGKRGETVYSYYSRLLGRRNYDRVLGPFFAAVPSQPADAFPVEGPGSLFKKRLRRQEFPRSFGFEGGLGTVCDGVAATPGVRVETGVEARRVARAGSGYAVALADGRSLEAPVVAVAVPPDTAARILNEDFHEVATRIARVRTVAVESLGAVLPRERCWMPEAAFLVAVDDVFLSAVTRDPFPDPSRRAFAFHFRPGVPREEKVRRMGEVLRVRPEELGELHEQRLTLPSPALGHAEIVAEIDRCLAGARLAVT